MRSVESQPSNPPELAWLIDVSESLLPLSESSPVYVSHGTVDQGPPRPHPERHPYCEISTLLEGRGYTVVENEKAWRQPGDVLILGPGVPDGGRIEQYPLRFITAYFLPWVPIEMGPESDGIRILRRFTARQSLSDRLLRPTRSLLTRLSARFQEIVTEFD